MSVWWEERIAPREGGEQVLSVPCVSMGVYVQCECDRGVRELGNSGIGDRGHRTGRVFYDGAGYCALPPGESHSDEV